MVKKSCRLSTTTIKKHTESPSLKKKFKKWYEFFFIYSISFAIVAFDKMISFEN